MLFTRYKSQEDFLIKLIILSSKLMNLEMSFKINNHKKLKIEFIWVEYLLISKKKMLKKFVNNLEI